MPIIRGPRLTEPMSLKAFHLVFVSISVLLALGLGTMTFMTFLQQRALAQLGWSVLSFAAAIALVVYGVRIRKKLWDIGLLAASSCLIFFARAGYACATCFGNPEAPQTQAMNMAILFMLILVAMVLTLFAAFFVHLRIRANRFANRQIDSPSASRCLEVNVNE